MVIIKDISYLNRIIPSEYRVCTSYTWILIVIMDRCMAGAIYILKHFLFCCVFIYWRHSLFNCFLYAVFIHLLSC